jgi:hypothetical protein
MQIHSNDVVNSRRGGVQRQQGDKPEEPGTHAHVSTQKKKAEHDISIESDELEGVLVRDLEQRLDPATQNATQYNTVTVRANSSQYTAVYHDTCSDMTNG